MTDTTAPKKKAKSAKPKENVQSVRYTASDQYRENYDRIDWQKQDKKPG